MSASNLAVRSLQSWRLHQGTKVEGVAGFKLVTTSDERRDSTFHNKWTGIELLGPGNFILEIQLTLEETIKYNERL